MTPTIESEVRVESDSGLNMTLRAMAPVANGRIGLSMNITARLVGSFGWMRPPTDWGLSVFAASPNAAASNVDDPRVTQSSPGDPFRYGLLIPQSQVDLSGKTCNKIGVSHAAFVNDQGQRCSGRINDCLSNQLDDIWSTSKENDHLVNQLCASVGGQFVRDDGYRLSCRLTDSASDTPTQVMLELNADKIAVVYNESIGEIRNITTSSKLVALVQRTDVTVEIVNMGTLTSEFVVSVGNCTPPLTYPLSASRLSLAPSDVGEVTVKLEDSKTQGDVYSCVACLTDSEGVILSNKVFSFNTSAIVPDRVAQSSDGTSGDASGSFTAADLNVDTDPCSNECSGFFSVICFISHTCWLKMGTLIGTLGGSSLALFLLTKLGAWSWMFNLVKGCCSCCGDKDQEKRRRSDIANQEVYLQNMNRQALDFVYPIPRHYPHPYTYVHHA